MTRRRLLIGLATGAAFGAELVLPAGLRVTRHEIPWRTKRRFRIVHLTDVHVGWTTPRRLLEEAARTAHALEPDLMVLTGDYVNRSLVHAGRLGRWIERLPRPCVATLGNHDHWSGADGVTSLLEAFDVRVLANERVTIGGIQLVGVDDARTRHHDLERAFHAVDRERPILALQHCPSLANELAERGASLILAGHTHAGQVAIPRVTPAVFSALGQPYAGGAYRVGGARLYVNAGLGHSRRMMRHGTRAAPELAVFDLVPERA